MERVTRQQLLLTFGWGISLLPFFRWWGVTLRAPNLPVWILIYVVLFAGTAALVFGGRAITTRRDVRGPILAWSGLALGLLVFVTLVPRVTLAGQPVLTNAFLLVFEMVIPIWIIVSAMQLIWTTWRARLLVLTLGPAAVAVALFGYTISMPGSSFAGPLPPMTTGQHESRRHLESTVQTLARDIGERNDSRYDALGAAVTFVDSVLTSFGYGVAREHFEYGGRAFYNLVATIPGTDDPDEIVVIGAHFDTAERTPGADDNASGTAGLLELARLLRPESFSRTIRFVAFTNEEPPFFSTEWMGSAQHARQAADRGDDIVAMLSLEGLGFYQDEEGSQGYPPPFNFFYPDVGNFVGFVGNLPSRALVRRVVDTFRRTTDFPSEGLAAPEQIPGVWWSDHAPFWNHGFRAIMITDTAPFRNPHYHQMTDTADRLDYDRMARVVWGVSEVIRELAGAVD